MCLEKREHLKWMSMFLVDTRLASLMNFHIGYIPVSENKIIFYKLTLHVQECNYKSEF
jgi:hypothetical protein